MSLSAKRSAYSDMPSVLSQSAICCIATTKRIFSLHARQDRKHTEFILTTVRLKALSRGLDTPTFWLADEVTE